MPKPKTLLARVRAELERVADPAKAPGMQAYMKSAMPYHGVPAVPFRKTVRPIFRALTLETFADWRDAVLELWRGAEFREERYAAIELAEARVSRPFQTLEALPVYEEMIVTGAWWDVVDAIATHRLRELLAKHAAPMRKIMLAWSRDDDMWKRRSSIICQVGRGAETELELLSACIEPSLDSKEFFLRKAIGWALRDYAWTDPDEIARWVAAHEDRLSGLSKREALKNVAKLQARARSGRSRR